MRRKPLPRLRELSSIARLSTELDASLRAGRLLQVELRVRRKGGRGANGLLPLLPPGLGLQ